MDEKNDEGGAMKRKCSRCGKEMKGNIALFSVNHKLPNDGREHACWECLTPHEKARHMHGKEAR